jgi:hypothetical protein
VEYHVGNASAIAPTSFVLRRLALPQVGTASQVFLAIVLRLVISKPSFIMN